MNPRSRPSTGSSGQRTSFAPLGRAIRYLGHYRKIAVIAYVSLFIATAAQLVVPQLVQNIIDAITNGFLAQQLNAIPDAVRSLALKQVGWTANQFQTNLTGGEQALIYAGLLIVLFSAARALFSYAQNYNAERVSQSIAFDFRNDLYTKIQRLSFSYHDQNQTGQLMIRATDDVEKLRTFIGQGLLMTVQAVVLLTGALTLLVITNVQLVIIILPVLPVAFVMFLVFGRIAQPLFMLAQQKLARLNTVLQENLAGIKVVKAFAREPEQQKRFDEAAVDQMQQQIQDRPRILLPFPGGLPDRQPGPVGHPLFWWAADRERHPDFRRMAEVQPLPDVRVFPFRPARIYYFANVSGCGLGPAYL